MKRPKKLVESEKYLLNDDQILSSDEVGKSNKIKLNMRNKGGSVLSKQSSSKLGASKGLSFNKSITDRKHSLKFNMESLKSLNKYSQVESTKNSKKGFKNSGQEEYFSRKGRLTSSNIPWTSRSPYTNKKDFGLEDLGSDNHLKYSDLVTSKKDKSNRLDPIQFIKEKSLKEKYRLEQIEQWKKENGHKKSKMSSGKIPSQYMKKLEASGNGLGNSYSSKEGLNQLYHKHKSTAKANTPGSFSGAQLNLKNFSSNTQMYNYGTVGHSNLNFSKNKFNMKQRYTNFITNSKADKFYNNSRNYLKSNEHLMPEINKKSESN